MNKFFNLYHRYRKYVRLRLDRSKNRVKNDDHHTTLGVLVFLSPRSHSFISYRYNWISSYPKRSHKPFTVCSIERIVLCCILFPALDVWAFAVSFVCLVYSIAFVSLCFRQGAWSLTMKLPTVLVSAVRSFLSATDDRLFTITIELLGKFELKSRPVGVNSCFWSKTKLV